MATHTDPLELRSRHLGVRLRPAEYDELEALARELERSTSSLARLAIRDYLTRSRGTDRKTTEGGRR